MTKQLDDRHVEIIARTTLEFYEKEKKKQEKQKHDRRLRNIKLLLRNYRSFVKHVEDIKLDILELDEKLELDEIDTDEFKIESIKHSKEKTLAMIKFINKMLVVYKTVCEQGKPEDLRRYETVYHMYISEKKKTAKEISEMQNIALRTVFIDIEKACKDLSVLIFGVDGIKFHQ